MKLYLLEPEVAGQIGNETLFNKNISAEYKNIEYLDYTFDGWLKDYLLEATPCFIVSNNIFNKIVSYNLSGFKLEKMNTSKSEEFIERHPNLNIPEFKRLLIFGSINIINGYFSNWSGHDFCLSDKNYLVVTENAFNFLKSCEVNCCEYTIVNSK